MPTADQIKRAWEKEAKWAEDARMRLIVREEIASLCGLLSRRLQDIELVLTSYEAIHGKVARDFGRAPDEPGPKAA